MRNAGGQWSLAAGAGLVQPQRLGPLQRALRDWRQSASRPNRHDISCLTSPDQPIQGFPKVKLDPSSEPLPP